MTINYRIKYRIDVGHRSPQLEFTFKILGYHSIRSVVCDSSLFLTPVYVSSTVCMLLLLVHIDRIGFRHDTLVYCKLFPQGFRQAEHANMSNPVVHLQCRFAIAYMFFNKIINNAW